jgi:hypothetical protein
VGSNKVAPLCIVKLVMRLVSSAVEDWHRYELRGIKLYPQLAGSDSEPLAVTFTYTAEAAWDDVHEMNPSAPR